MAALGSDYNFSANDAHIAAASNEYALHSGPVTIDWANYLKKESGNSYSKYMDLISTFTDNVLELKSQGYYVPNVSFNYILNTLLP